MREEEGRNHQAIIDTTRRKGIRVKDCKSWHDHTSCVHNSAHYGNDRRMNVSRRNISLPQRSMSHFASLGTRAPSKNKKIAGTRRGMTFSTCRDIPNTRDTYAHLEHEVVAAGQRFEPHEAHDACVREAPKHSCLLQHTIHLRLCPEYDGQGEEGKGWGEITRRGRKKNASSKRLQYRVDITPTSRTDRPGPMGANAIELYRRVQRLSRVPCSFS